MKITRIAIIPIVLILFSGCFIGQIDTVSSASRHYKCSKPASEAEIASLFDHWNQTLQTSDPGKVVSLYAEKSILLPTLSNKPRLTPAEKEEYFLHFLQKSPSAKIDFRQIEIGCDMAVDSGLYTFKFAKSGEVVKGRYSFVYRWDGSKWLIISHHSSLMPEEK